MTTATQRRHASTASDVATGPTGGAVPGTSGAAVPEAGTAARFAVRAAVLAPTAGGRAPRFDFLDRLRR